MRVLHVVASLSEEWGGPPRVVVPLTEALARKGVQCSIFAPAFPRNGHPLQPEGVEVRLFPADWLARWWTAHSRSLADALKNAVSGFDVVHIHELWHHAHYAAARAAARAGKPYLISVHGELEPWALRYKGWKKRPYMLLVQRKLLRDAAAIHALTDAEAQLARQNGVVSTVRVVPPGIASEEFRALPPKETFDQQHPELAGKRVVIFLGRLHPGKGLDALAAAFGHMARERDDLRLVIAGPDEKGYGEQVRRYLREAGVLDKALFTGLLKRDDRLAALARADLFVLPSRSEGFSVAVLEAMAAGCPVVISPESHFPEVARAGAGLVVESDPRGLAHAIMGLLDDPTASKKMGERGRAMVMERYTWDRVADMYVDMYASVLAGVRSGPTVARSRSR